jgi:hypothetical protein
MDGTSLLRSTRRDRLLLEFWATDYTPSWASLRTPAYQYVEYYDGTGAVQFREYYDLVRDPWQLENVLGDATPTNDPDVQALSDQLSQDRACTGNRGSRRCP